MFDFTKEQLEMLPKEQLIELILSQQELLISSMKVVESAKALITQIKEKMQ
jgi:hypothetical protein